MSESWLNASVWLGLSVLNQGGTSCLLELRGPPRVAFRVVLPIGALSTGSGEGCHLLGLGDSFGTGVGEWLEWAVLPQGKSSVVGQMDAMEVFAPIGCGRKYPGHFYNLQWAVVQGDLRGGEEVSLTSGLLSNGLFLQVPHDVAMFLLE